MDNEIYTSKRFEFSSLLLSGIMITYILRVNMSIAVKSMSDDYNWSDYEKGRMDSYEVMMMHIDGYMNG